MLIIECINDFLDVRIIAVRDRLLEDQFDLSHACQQATSMSYRPNMEKRLNYSVTLNYLRSKSVM